MESKNHIYVLLIVAIFLFGCSKNSPTEPEAAASFEIISTIEGTGSFGKPNVTLTVKNTGNATGHNVSCDTNAKNADGVIIDTASTFFAGLGNILSGESAEDAGTFFDLSSSSDYASISSSCSWLTA